MKLDGELAFYHSNIGCEPESQSFEFDENDLDYSGCRSGKQKVSEMEKGVKNKEDLNLLPYEMDSDKDGLITESKLDSDMNIIDQKNDDDDDDNEVKVKEFVEPVSHSSCEMESFGKFPFVPFPDSSQDSPEEVDSFKNPTDIYTDKSVMECQPELEVCYKDSGYHVVKDICVDEGIPAKEHNKLLLLSENDVNEEANYKESEKPSKDNIGIDDEPFPGLVDSPGKEGSDKVSADHHEPKDLMLGDEDASGKHADKVMVFTEQNFAQVTSEPEVHPKPQESEDRVGEAVSTSPLALSVDGSNGDTTASDDAPANGSIGARSDPPVPAAGATEESHKVGGLKCDDTQNSPETADDKSTDQAVTSHVRRSLGESSFSAVGQLSSRISYSGPMPYSGSISLRSDSSTTSTRSFAFPVLQSEWNSSPVRMAKADRRHYRKYRGWRHGLLCCRF